MQMGWPREIHKTIHEDSKWRPDAGWAHRGFGSHSQCQPEPIPHPGTCPGAIISACSRLPATPVLHRICLISEATHLHTPMPGTAGAQGSGTSEWQAGDYKRWPSASPSYQLCSVFVFWSPVWDWLDSRQGIILSCLSCFQLSRIEWC